MSPLVDLWWRLGVRGFLGDFLGDFLGLGDLGELSSGLCRAGGGARRRSNSSCPTTVIELGIVASL